MREDNLHSYQKHAVDYVLQKQNCGLFLEMGLGKTIVTLTAIVKLMFENLEVNKVLVIAPKFVAENVWQQEAQKWEHTRHLRFSIVTGTQAQRRTALTQKADVYITNRENTAWIVGLYQSAFPFDMLIIDELSSFKSPAAQRFKALRRVRPSRVVGLTGTPAPNGLIDLWSQMYLIDRGARLGQTLTGYRQKYFDPGRRNGQVIFDYKLKNDGEQAIHKAIADVCMSMKAEDYLELKGRITKEVQVPMTRVVAKKYEDFERTLILEISEEEEITAVNAAVLSGKLRQFCNGAVYSEAEGIRDYREIHDLKLQALEQVIEEANGSPVLVYYEFKHDLERIFKALKAYNPQVLDKQSIEQWNSGRIQVLLAHPASAGHGLNLQYGGNFIVWFGCSWSLELYQQANARLDRQGQTKPVTIFHLVLKNSVDEEVLKSLSAKAESQESLMQFIKARIKKHKYGRFRQN